MGQDAQLDLGVVRVHQRAALRRREHPAELAAKVRPCGDVLQVRLRGAEAARGGDGHLELRPHPPVGVHGLQKAVGVGGFQLGVLPVLQHRVHNGVLKAELFQHVGIGGPAGLGLLPVGEAQALKQHLSQLLRGVDVEGPPGHLVNGGLLPGDPGGQALAEVPQGPGVHAAARPLHLRQHPAEGQLGGLEQFPLAPLPEPGGQGAVQGLHRRGIAVQGGGGVPVSQEGEGVRLQVQRLGQLLVEVGDKEALKVIAPRRGVQQVGRQGRVKDEALRRKAVFQQRPRQVLDVVGDLFDLLRKKGRQQAVPIPLIALEEQLRHYGAALSRLAEDPRGGAVRQGQQGHVVRRLPEVQQLRPPGGVRHGLHGGGGFLPGLGGRGGPGAEAEFLHELGELQLQKQRIGPGARGPAQIVLRVEVQGRVGDDGGQPAGMPGVRLPLRQLFDHAGLGGSIRGGHDFRHVGIEMVNGAIHLNQAHGGLFPHALHAGDVVGAVPHQGLEVDHMNGVKAVFLPEGRLRHVLCGGLAHAGGDQLHPGRFVDKLEAVLVPGDHDALPARRPAFPGDCAQKVVRLPALQLIAGDVQRVQDFL